MGELSSIILGTLPVRIVCRKGMSRCGCRNALLLTIVGTVTGSTLFAFANNRRIALLFLTKVDIHSGRCRKSKRQSDAGQIQFVDIEYIPVSMTGVGQ